MLVFRSDGTLPSELVEGLREQLERASASWPGLCEAYAYRMRPGSATRELVVRLTAGQTVVPLLFRPDDLPAGRVFATVRGVLAQAL